jgi:amidophosphoribosyltransferase
MATPSVDELIGANKSIEEIRDFVGADSLGYLSHNALKASIGDTDNSYCYACFTGEYPKTSELVYLS